MSRKRYTTKEPCVVCLRTPACLHHIKTRGSGGTDDDWNLMPLCLGHHNRVHAIGLRPFATHNSGAYNFLIKHGWEFDDIFNKWRHYGEEK